MASVRTTFRERLQEILTGVLGVKFVGGRLEGPQEDQNIGCVWWEGKRPWGRDGNEEENFYRVRYFKLFRQEQGDTTRRNIAGMEDAAEELEAALQDVLATVGHGFFTVLEVTPDYLDQFVEVQLVAYDRNRSAAGG